MLYYFIEKYVTDNKKEKNEVQTRAKYTLQNLCRKLQHRILHGIG